MNKYYMDEEAYRYLNDWAKENREAIIWSPPYFADCEVILKKSDFKFYVSAKKDRHKFSLKGDGGIIYSGNICRDENEKNDFAIQYKAKKNDCAKDYSDVLLTYVNAFIMANCFMWRGNLLTEKLYTASGKNKGDSKIITFRKYKNTIFAIPTSNRRSPDGVFSVRGHFRQYKSGKIIWIDEFLKGTDKNV